MSKDIRYIWIVFPLMLILITTVGVVLDEAVQRNALDDFFQREESHARRAIVSLLDDSAGYVNALTTLTECPGIRTLDDLCLAIDLLYEKLTRRRASALIRIFIPGDDTAVYCSQAGFDSSLPGAFAAESSNSVVSGAISQAQDTGQLILSEPYPLDGDVRLTINKPFGVEELEGVVVSVVSLSAIIERVLTTEDDKAYRFLLDDAGRVIDDRAETEPLTPLLRLFEAEGTALGELLSLRLRLGLPGIVRLRSRTAIDTHDDQLLFYTPFELGGMRFYLVSQNDWDDVVGPLSRAQQTNWILFGSLLALTTLLGAYLWRRQNRRLHRELTEGLERAAAERRRSQENLRSISRALTLGGDIEQTVSLVGSYIIEAFKLNGIQVILTAEYGERLLRSETDEPAVTLCISIHPDRMPARIEPDSLPSGLVSALWHSGGASGNPFFVDDPAAIPDSTGPDVKVFLPRPGNPLVVCPLRSRTGFEGYALLDPREPLTELKELEASIGYLSQGIGAARIEEGRRRTLTELDSSYSRLRDFNTIGTEILGSMDLVHICRRIVDAITTHSTFQRAVLSLYEDGVFHRFAFSNLSEAEIQRLLSGPVWTMERIETIKSLAVPVGKCYHVPAEKADRELYDHSVPSKASPETFTDWSPDDFFYVPLIGRDGEFLGIISVDDPRDGRVPTETSIQPLESFANLAAQAIATTRLSERLSRSREEYRTLFNDASDALFELDDKWRIINANRKFSELTGRPRDGEEQAELSSFFDGDDEHSLRRALERLESGLGLQVIELGYKHPESGRRILELKVDRRRETSLISELKGIYQGSIRDITEAKEAENELLRRQEQLNLINKLGRLALSTFDRKALMLQTADALKDDLGYDNIAVFIVDEDTDELVLEAIRGFYEVLIGVGFSVYRDQGIVGWAATTGTTRYVPDVFAEERYIQPVDVFEIGSELCIPLLVEGETVGVLDIQAKKTNAFDIADISALETIADQLSQAIHNINLYQELREKALAVAVANEELIKLDQLKSDFVSMVSHELNTPVTVIKGYAQLMYNRIIGEITDKQAELLKTVIDKADSLTGLINELLDLLKLESGQYELQLEETNVSQMLEDFFEKQDEYIDTPRMKLVLDLPKDPVILNVDKGKLYMAFVHLLSNASKFTIGEGSVTISAREHGVDYEFTVADTGTGIPESEFDKIFERLYQVESTLTRHYGGTGLGLAITRAVVQRHHGKIWVESELGVGSRFHFTIPKDLSLRGDIWENLE